MSSQYFLTPTRHGSARKDAAAVAVIYLIGASHSFGTQAAYPPAMGEQPIAVWSHPVETGKDAIHIVPHAGIHGLATHKTCGMLCRHSTRWALTPPFHHRVNALYVAMPQSFSVTLLCRRRQLSVKEYGALCCPDFPLAAQCLPRSYTLGKRHDRPATDRKFTYFFGTL